MRKNSVTREQDVFKKDLSSERGSYTKAIQDNMPKLNGLSEDGCVGLEEYIAAVKKIVAKAHDTPAKANFVATLTKMRTKSEAVFFVYQAYLKGCGLGVI